MRDHISAANERDLTTELEILRGEFRELTAKCADAEAKNKTLEAQLVTPPKAEDRLEENAEKILKFYYDANEDVAIKYAASRLAR